jgi:hypothetical protein
MARRVGLVVVLLSVLLSCSLLLPDVEVTVVNETAIPVRDLYARHADTEEWGSSLLEADLEASQTVTFMLPKAQYEFRWVFLDNTAWESSTYDLSNVEYFDLSLEEAVQ